MLYFPIPTLVAYRLWSSPRHLWTYNELFQISCSLFPQFKRVLRFPWCFVPESLRISRLYLKKIWTWIENGCYFATQTPLNFQRSPSLSWQNLMWNAYCCLPIDLPMRGRRLGLTADIGHILSLCHALISFCFVFIILILLYASSVIIKYQKVKAGCRD